MLAGPTGAPPGTLTQKLQQLSGVAAAIVAQHGSSLQYHDQDVLNLLAAGPPAGPAWGAAQGPTSSAGSLHAAPGWVELSLRWNAQGIGGYARFRLREEPARPALFGSAAELRRYEEQPVVRRWRTQLHFRTRAGPLGCQQQCMQAMAVASLLPCTSAGRALHWPPPSPRPQSTSTPG